ncbi:hypothetical protein CKA32_004615 [Geitlerinema sp. FC II]|nr:hypothetical protein CKA32_004615 [Geitlerinema sp. FC II]
MIVRIKKNEQREQIERVHLKNVNLYERIRISASNSHIFAKLRCTR